MIISSPTDFNAAARRKLPRFLFDYLDGGAGAEMTLRRNLSDLSSIVLRQRVLTGVSEVHLGVELFGRKQALPVILAPVGLTGMYARRGEVQAARAAAAADIPFCLSTVSVCAAGGSRSAIQRSFVVSALHASRPWLHARIAGAGKGGRL